MSLSTLMCRDVLQTVFHQSWRQPHSRIVSPTASWLRYVPDRRVLVDWTAELMLTNFSLPTQAHHNCVRLLDRVASARAIERSQLQLYAIVCVELSMKMHENMVSPAWLLSACDGQYTLQQMRASEKIVLCTLAWDLARSTPLELASWLLADVHAQLTAQSEADPLNPVLAQALQIHTGLVQFVSYFADLALQDSRFEEYPDALRAAAFVYNGRKALGLTDVWSTYLAHISQLSLHDFAECAELLWSLHWETQSPQQHTSFSSVDSDFKSDPDVNYPTSAGTPDSISQILASVSMNTDSETESSPDME